MKILLNSLNYSPELTGIGKYNSEMCASLTELGVQVSAVVAKPYYPEWSIHEGYSNFWYSTSSANNVLIYRCPLYIPKSPTLLKRVLHLFSFSVTSGLVLILESFKKPDIIFVVQPSLFCAPMALLIGKLTRAKTVMHIQDFEADAVFGLNRSLLVHRRVRKLVEFTERWLLRKFDLVSSISDAMIENARAKGVDNSKLVLFPNWSDVDFVTPKTSGVELKRELGFATKDRIILYSGNIGEKQGLEIVIEAADVLKSNETIKFVFVGSGSFLDKLKNIVDSRKLTNVYFLPLLSWDKVPQLLTMADIHLVIQRKAVANAVLPSKLTNILSAGGHAIVTAEKDTELEKLSVRYPGIFCCIEPENISMFINTLSSMLEKKLPEYNVVAREFALKNLSKDRIITKFYKRLNDLISN